MKIRPFIDRRNSIAQLFVVLLCVGILAVLVATWTQAQSSPNGRAPIDVVVLEDGTKEHVLINDGRDRMPGTDDDQYWVLRVPADFYSASFEDLIRERQGREPHPDFIYNRDLAISVPYSVQQDGELKSDLASSKTVTIVLSFEYRDYDVEGWSARGSFLSHFENTIADYCWVISEISPGVMELRDLTTEELQDRVSDGSITQIEGNVYRGCRPISENGDGFSVFVDGAPVGWMSCFKAEVEPPSPECDLNAWMYPRLVVSMDFPNEDRGIAPNMYSYVQDVIRRFTDLSRSQNIEFREE